jgi:hypothetical protein
MLLLVSSNKAILTVFSEVVPLAEENVSAVATVSGTSMLRVSPVSIRKVRIRVLFKIFFMT